MIRPPPWLLHGSLGKVPHLSDATMQRLRLPSFISVARLPLQYDTLGAVRVFATSSSQPWPMSGALVNRVALKSGDYQRNGRLSHLPAKPQCCFA